MQKKHKVAIILSGCGVYDGSEIHEAVMSMYAVAHLGGEYQLFAPDSKQHHVVNHLTGEEMKEERNVLIESARIARGNIKKLSALRIEDFAAVIFPGGFGVAKNLSDFAFKGSECAVNESVKKIVLEAVQKEKPIGALCISPAIIANIIKQNVKVTIGNDSDTAKAVECFGGSHIEASLGEAIVDEQFKVVTTPCYMLDAKITDIAAGAENVVRKIFEML